MNKNLKKVRDVGAFILIAGFMVFVCLYGCYNSAQTVNNNFAAVYLREHNK